MASFGAMVLFRTGYYAGARAWLLRERRTVEDRVKYLNAEMQRVGYVWVEYAKTSTDDGTVVCTEDRLQMVCTHNSSLEKLLRAYIAQGGNPLDISMFLHPDKTNSTDVGDGSDTFQESQPYGGVASPLSYNYHANVDYADGEIEQTKYPRR